MSSQRTEKKGVPYPVDSIALALQTFASRRKKEQDMPLVRLENRKESAKAPFQFDPDTGLLHKTGCASIKEDSKSALYAIGSISKDDERFACPRCSPMTDDNKKEPSLDPTDVLYGLLSIVDQFGTILHERGREFRETDRGRHAEKTLSGLMGNLDEQHKKSVTTIVRGMDTLIKTFTNFTATMDAKAKSGLVGKRSAKTAPRKKTKKQST
jgi:hypothetical protein